MDELFVRTHIPESSFNGFFRWCRTFWLLTIIPLDQTWSTYVTMKVIVNQENREKSEFVMILNDFHCDISTSIWFDGIIVSNQNVLHDLENSLE